MKNQLKNIYICGYSMSLLSSIFAGFWTDKLGRKGASICCCMLYVCSCMSVYSNSITLLYVGRVLGGFASTLFHTAFESWLNGSDIKKKIVNELFTYRHPLAVSLPYFQVELHITQRNILVFLAHLV